MIYLGIIAQKLKASGKVTIKYETLFKSLIGSSSVNTNSGGIEYKRIINAAGAYAEKIALSFGLAKEYKLIPFKGTYKKLSPESSGLVNGNIYPVPDLITLFSEFILLEA